MFVKTQLLCTFTSTEELDNTITQILETYKVSNPMRIYVLENINESNSLYCTYNVIWDKNIVYNHLLSTISLHRKKLSNTLYTINALNLLIKELNNGHEDPNFIVEWNDYKNTILLSVNNELKLIKTKLNKMIPLE